MENPDGYAHPELLWSVEDLHARLGEESLVILDVRSAHQIMPGIIPGAAHLDLYGLGTTNSRPEPFESWVEMMRSQLALRGIGMDTTVLVYEEDSTGLKAARAFWLLEYFGHGNVHILDGGIAAWRAAGYEVTREMAAPKARRLEISPKADIYMDAEELNGLLGQDDLAVLDTRSDDEWTGKNTRGGPRGGTIPGGIHLEWVKYLDKQGKMLPAAELNAMFTAQGIVREKRIVPF